MTAAEQVFDVAELREIIICQVDAHQILELKLVNRSWCNAIAASKAARRARVITSLDNNDPDTIPDPVKMSQAEIEDAYTKEMCLPLVLTAIYSWSAWLRVNPSLTKVHLQHYKDIMALTIRLPSATEPSSSQSMDKFVTDPPCQHLTLRRMMWQQKSWLVVRPAISCSVYRKEGVRIRDILVVRDQLLEWQNDIVEIVASLMVYTAAPTPRSAAEERIHRMYTSGPLPRYRKPTHILDREGVAAYRKDQDMEWDPSMDEAPSEETSATGTVT